MSREIKFRAWDKTYKGMHDVVLLDLDSEDSAVVYVDEYGDRQRRSLIHIDLMQYTGVKDKNGVEIYEGDIVRVYQNGIVLHHEEVEWSRERLGYIGILQDEGGYFTYEVIGDIHQNPELLKEILQSISPKKKILTKTVTARISSL